MSILIPATRSAGESDAPGIAAIYAPYVRDTAVSFEVEPPTADIIRQRIARTLETHSWLVAEHGGETIGFAYAGKHSERAGYRRTVDGLCGYDKATRRRWPRALCGPVGNPATARLSVSLRRDRLAESRQRALARDSRVQAYRRPPRHRFQARKSATGALLWPKVLSHLANPCRLPSFEKRQSSRAQSVKADEIRAGPWGRMSVSIMRRCSRQFPCSRDRDVAAGSGQ
jgi:hypothetical protein